MTDARDDLWREVEGALRALCPNASDAAIADAMGEFRQSAAHFERRVNADVSGYCIECRHPMTEHDHLIEGGGAALNDGYNEDGLVDLYQCDHYEGMGNWCGCEVGSRQPTRRREGL